MIWNVLTVICLVCFQSLASPRLPDKQSKARDEHVHVEVHLAVSSPSVRIGGSPILVRVELWNKGENDFFAADFLAANTSAPAYMIVYVQDPSGKRAPLEQMDAIMSSEAMNDSWTRISPWHYYGIQFPLKPSEYQAISSPGRYKLTAEYVSRGGLTPSSPDWSVPSHKVWEGKLDSNSVWIQVLPYR